MKKSGFQRVQSFRRFYLPLIYGLAGANFIAVIQLVSAPQLDIHWKDLIPPETSELLPFLGFCGMILMTASIPILLGFAIYTELAVRAGHYNRKLPVRALTRVAVLGMMGPGLAFFAFHPAFGFAYFAALTGSLVASEAAIRRFKIKEDSN